jgi:hypothetical protein
MEMDSNGDVTTSSTPTGTYNLVAVVTNEAGCVFGTLDFTIEVTA